MRSESKACVRELTVVLFGIAVAMVLIHVPIAKAFIPKNWQAYLLLTPDSDTHESITTSSIRDLDMEFFGKVTNPMDKATKQIVEGNASVDDDQVTSAKHFDGENFSGGQALINSLVQDVVAQLKIKPSNTPKARESLGKALHTIQDFYSHSNWVENNGASAYSELGKPTSSLTELPASTKTCKGCVPCIDCDANLLTTTLTSGYFAGIGLTAVTPEDRLKPNSDKCSHGGYKDGSESVFTASGGINKDTVLCDLSPHGTGLHSSAVAAAKESTKNLIRYVKTQVTEGQFKSLLGAGPALTISIDTTGSMGSIIQSVKTQAIAIVDARLGTDEEPSKYILAPFNDPSVGPVTVTDDPNVFKSAINALSASGGDDCPELAMAGMLQGLSVSDDGGSLFMFTDASAKDSSSSGAVSSLATSKDIKVYPILFGSCSPIDPGYIKVANDSGGQLFFLSAAEAGNITKLADLTSRSSAVNILSVGSSATGIQTFQVPIDSTMSRVTFSLSGPNAVTLKTPDGSTVTSSTVGATFITLSGGIAVSLSAPPPGNWIVSFVSSGDFSLSVTGESPLNLNSFSFVRQGGRPGHEGLFDIGGSPAAGQLATVEAIMTGPFGSASFDLRGRNGNLMQSLGLQQGTGVALNNFVGTFVPPGLPFVVYVTGTDTTGRPYQRVVPASIQAQNVTVSQPSPQNLRPGQAISYIFHVVNLGPQGLFQFASKDDRSFVISTTPTSAQLATNEAVDVTVQLRAPAGTPIGTTDTLSFTAQSATAMNSAIVTSSVSSSSIGQPALSARVIGQGAVGESEQFVDVEFTNFGTGDAASFMVSRVIPRTLSGTGSVIVSDSIAFPVSGPATQIGHTTVMRFVFIVPPSVNRFSITETGAIQNLLNTPYSWSASQAIIPQR